LLKVIGEKSFNDCSFSKQRANFYPMDVLYWKWVSGIFMTSRISTATGKILIGGWNFHRQGQLPFPLSMVLPNQAADNSEFLPRDITAALIFLRDGRQHWRVSLVEPDAIVTLRHPSGLFPSSLPTKDNHKVVQVGMIVDFVIIIKEEG